MEYMLQPKAKRPPSRSRENELDWGNSYRPRYQSPKMNYSNRDRVEDHYSDGDSRQYTSVWKKFDVQRPPPGQFGSNQRFQDSMESRGMPYHQYGEEKRGFMPPKHSLSHFKQGAAFNAPQYFSQSSLNQLKDFLSGPHALDTATIEQILLPPRTYHLYRSTEDLKRSLEPQLERDMQKIREDIDSFVLCLQSLFEEIKKLLLAKVMQSEFDLKEYITTFTQNVDRYLKETSMALVEGKRRNQYFSMSPQYGNDDESMHMDREINDMHKQRKTMQMTENALKVIRHQRRNYKIVEMTEAIDTFFMTDRTVYHRDQFRRIFGDLRDELVTNIEDMDLFRDNNLIKKLELNLDAVNTGSYTQSMQNKSSPEYTSFKQPKAQGGFVPFQKKTDDSFQDVLHLNKTITDLSQSQVSHSHYSEKKLVGYRTTDKNSPRDQLVTVMPRDSIKMVSDREGKGSLNDSLLANAQRRKLIEEREKEFKKKTGEHMWQSRVQDETGIYGNPGVSMNIQRNVLQPPLLEPAKQDDNMSWKFLESIKKNFFGN